MKLTRTMVVSVAMFGAIAGSASAQDGPVVDDGLVAAWSFDGSAASSAGQRDTRLTARDGRGGPSDLRFVEAADVPGTLGGALALGVEEGDPEYLAAPNSAWMQLGPTYSIEAWIHPTQLGTWNRLVLHWGAGPVYAYHLAVHNGTLSLCHGQAEGQPAASITKPKPATEDRAQPPKPIQHPVVFADTADPDYGTILAHLEAAKAKLDEIKRFDMPGFTPNEHYVREMKRYGVLPASFDLEKDPIDVYATDRAYWESFWHRAGH